MAKKYILKAIGSGRRESVVRNFQPNLFDLSAAGISYDEHLIKNIRGLGAQETKNTYYSDAFPSYDDNTPESNYLHSSSVTGQNDFIAFYDKTYENRRAFLEKFALQGEIEYIIECISDEVVVNDEYHFFAYPNVEQLKSVLKPENGEEIVNDINSAYRRIYNAWGFNEGNDAWNYCKKFLIDGFLAFEIIYDTAESTGKATNIIGFQELDPITLEPDIQKDANGNSVKVWVQFKGDPDRERVLLDTNVIYISWTKNCFISRLSYVERLVRSFNMLRTIENSRLIWNMQNAQRRVKITIPVGSQSEQKARTRVQQMAAYYKEDIMIDDNSGEVTVNGEPKFPFYKTFFFPQKDGQSVDMSEMAMDGHDLNSTEQLKYFWNRLMVDSKLPRDRFSAIMTGDGQSSVYIENSTTVSREEYKFSLFIGRIRDIYQELLVKPMWMQFSLKHPDFSTNNVLKSNVGITYNNENIFVLEKKRSIVSEGANMLSSLSAISGADGRPFFSSEFLVREFLGLSDADLDLNAKYKKDEEKDMAKASMNGNGGMAGPDMNMGGGPIGGGMPPMGGGGEDMSTPPPASSGDFGGGGAPSSEEAPAEGASAPPAE